MQSINISELPKVDRSRDPYFITPEEWQQMILRAAASRSRVTAGPTDESSLRHPWKTYVEWDNEKEQWMVRVSRGSIRGLVIDREPFPITAWDTVVSDKLTFNVESNDTLAMRPTVEASEPDTALGELKERYFVWRGPDDERDADEVRGLKRVFIYLSVMRPQVNLEAFEDAELPKFFYPDYDENPPTVGWRVKPPTAPADQDIIQALYEPFDRCLLATVWMLGPLGELSAEKVDNSWTPLVQQETWWNLDYVPHPKPLKVAPFRLRALAISPYGLSTIQSLVDDLNQRYAESELRLFLATLHNHGQFFSV